MQREAAFNSTPDLPQTPDDATYIVAYARVVDDKHDGVYMTGVYFGGVGNTYKEAEHIARELVNTTKGGTILPRIVPTDGKTAMDAIRMAAKRFQQIELQMFQAEDILDRNAALAKSRR